MLVIFVICGCCCCFRLYLCVGLVVLGGGYCRSLVCDGLVLIVCLCCVCCC